MIEIRLKYKDRLSYINNLYKKPNFSKFLYDCHINKEIIINVIFFL